MSNLPISKQAIIDVLIFITMCVPLLVLHLLGEPVTVGFFCDDVSIGLPYRPDTISQALLLLASFGGPFLVIAVTEIIRVAVDSRQSHRMRTALFTYAKAYSVFLFGMATVCMLTDSIKYSVGRLRPHFLDLCKPDFTKFNCTSQDGTPRYILEYECTNSIADEKLLTDSHLSFPSGHASLSMYSALFAIFYLQMRMEIKFSFLLRPVLQMTILVSAILCCVTRVTDHKHFTTDVFGGAVLGATVAWLAFEKLARRVIPTSCSNKPPRLPRATSIESEPQTPTPLLRPERLIINHPYRHGSGPFTKDDFANKV